jgi:hypothetical protein
MVKAEPEMVQGERAAVSQGQRERIEKAYELCAVGQGSGAVFVCCELL